MVGYNVSKSLCVEGSLKAVKTALSNRVEDISSFIHHSDRGLQYYSNYYQKLLLKNNIKPSVTKYDPYEKAIAERVSGVLKE